MPFCWCPFCRYSRTSSSLASKYLIVTTSGCQGRKKITGQRETTFCMGWYAHSYEIRIKTSDRRWKHVISTNIVTDDAMLCGTLSRIYNCSCSLRTWSLMKCTLILFVTWVLQVLVSCCIGLHGINRKVCGPCVSLLRNKFILRPLAPRKYWAQAL